MDKIALILGEATITLYPSNSTGDAILDDPVWSGAVAHGLRLGKNFRKAEIWATGEDHPFKNHEGISYEINIGRVWFIPILTLADFDPQPNDRWVMVISWIDQYTKIWHRRTYLGVSCEGWELNSNGMMEFAFDQRFEAETELRESGRVPYTALAINESTVADEMYLFIHEEKPAAGNYLLGHYAWPEQVQVDSAKVISRAPQSTAMVIELEVGGTLTGHQITIPVGTVGELVQVSSSFSHAIDAGQTARWKAISGPVSAGDWGYDMAVVMKKKS